MVGKTGLRPHAPPGERVAHRGSDRPAHQARGCLLIGTNVAVFPHGTEWRDPNLVFGDGTTAAVGTQVRMGGGYFDADAATHDGLPIVPVSRLQDCARRAGVEGFAWAMP